MKKFFGLSILFIFIIFNMAYADRGLISFTPNVKIFEPTQRAMIAWNGEEEILLLSTDLKSSEPTKVLEVMPFLSEPIVKRGDIGVFKKATNFINERLPRVKYMGRGDVKGQREGARITNLPAGEVILRKIIGAHDISVTHLLNKDGFIEWVEGYLKSAGVDNPAISEGIKTAVAEYIKEGFSWFAFDVVSLDEELKTNDAIQYQFKTDFLFYPLKITQTAEGYTSIDLIVLTPYLLNSFPGVSVNLLHTPVSISSNELRSLNEDMADLLKDYPEMKLRIWQIQGKLSSFNKDLIAKREEKKERIPYPYPELPSGSVVRKNLRLVSGQSIILDDFKMKLQVLKIERDACLLEVTFSEKDKFSGYKDYSQYAYDKATPVVLYRNVRNCADHTFCPGHERNQCIDLKLTYYRNYACRLRYHEQCIYDGTFDCYDEEYCDYFPVWFAKGETNDFGPLKFSLVDLGHESATFDIIYIGIYTRPILSDITKTFPVLDVPVPGEK